MALFVLSSSPAPPPAVLSKEIQHRQLGFPIGQLSESANSISPKGFEPLEIGQQKVQVPFEDEEFIYRLQLSTQIRRSVEACYIGLGDFSNLYKFGVHLRQNTTPTVQRHHREWALIPRAEGA